MNRSDAVIAILPGIVVPPCSQAGFTAAQVEAAQSAWEAAFANDDESWIPAEAVQFTRGLAGRRIGAHKPLTVIVSGSADPRLVDGSVPPQEFPACGGAPLGIS